MEFPVGEWFKVTEDASYDITGAGGPEPLPTPMGVFAWSDEVAGVIVDVSDEGYVVLSTLDPDGDISVFITPPAS